MLSAAYVAYAGGLDSTFRASALEHWKSSLRSTGIVHNRGFDFSSAVGDDAQISDWLDAGLPNSKNAIESAIIMDLSRRWPLVIDPQEQAIAWLRKLHSNQNLIQVSDPTKGLWKEVQSDCGASQAGWIGPKDEGRPSAAAAIVQELPLSAVVPSPPEAPPFLPSP